MATSVRRATCCSGTAADHLTNIGQLSTPLEDSFCAALGGAARLAGRWWIVVRMVTSPRCPSWACSSPAISRRGRVPAISGGRRCPTCTSARGGASGTSTAARGPIPPPAHRVVGRARGHRDRKCRRAVRLTLHLLQRDLLELLRLLRRLRVDMQVAGDPLQQYMAGSAATNFRYVYALGPGRRRRPSGVSALRCTTKRRP